MKGRSIFYLEEELAWIEANRHLPRRDLHSAFCFRFGRKDVSQVNLTSLCKRKGWLTGRTGTFVKGQVPMNKGKKMPYNENSARTRFQKGQRPANKYDIGHETIDKDGYVRLCVDEPNPWTGHRTHMAFKHKWLWEKLHGPVPKGMALKCLDGDKTNTDPSNWEAIPKSMLPRLAGRWNQPYDTAPAEVKPTLMAVAKLDDKVRQVRKGRQA